MTILDFQTERDALASSEKQISWFDMLHNTVSLQRLAHKDPDIPLNNSRDSTW